MEESHDLFQVDKEVVVVGVAKRRRKPRTQNTEWDFAKTSALIAAVESRDLIWNHTLPNFKTRRIDLHMGEQMKIFSPSPGTER